MSESLRQLQLSFLAAIEHGVDKQDAILSEIISSDDFNAEQRWLVYRDSITAAFLNTLEVLFPVCKKLVGEQFFIAMAKVAIAKTPSRSPDINEYGASFPDFIANFEHAKALPYLADVAALEWAVHLASNGKDSLAMDFAKLTAIAEKDSEQLCFKLPANGTLLSSNYPIDKIWQVNQNEYVGDEVVQLDNDPCHLLVWRQNYDVIFARLDEAQYYVLQQFAVGLELQAVIEKAHSQEIDVSKMLPELVELGYIANFQ